MATSNYPLALTLLILYIQTLVLFSQADVPVSSTFKFVNEGELGQYISEYNPDYRPLDVFRFPFQLCFYNTTHNAYTLGLRMGTRRSTSTMRWVWDANRGNPVRENATFSFGTDGNLVLADYDGRVVWQSGTANKGVVRFELLPTGNMVLFDKTGNYLWQSFDHPTDTLLVGQSLRVGGPTKLISRTSAENNTDGPYSFELEPSKGLAMYYKSASSPKPLIYFSTSEWFTIKKGSGIIENMTFTCETRAEGESNLSILTFTYGTSPYNPSVGHAVLAYPKYNSTLSYLRLGIDGNIRFYTYDEFVTWGAWEKTYTMFDDESEVSKCQLPEKCGKFGLCEDGQCIACPLPSGLMGWSKSCEPIKVPSCIASDFKYYMVEGVDHFTTKYTTGNGVTEKVCESKCTKDCKCMGYFYHKTTSKCWIAYDLKTLSKVSNSSNVAYIKTPISS